MNCPDCGHELLEWSTYAVYRCSFCSRSWSQEELDDAAGMEQMMSLTAERDALAAENARLRKLISEANAFVIGWANGHGTVDANGDCHPNEIAMRLQRRMQDALK